MKFVSEDYGASDLAKRFGVARYPALFVNEVLVAKPKDFGFYGKGEGGGDGRYTPFRSAESHRRLQDDLRAMIRRALDGTLAGSPRAADGSAPPARDLVKEPDVLPEPGALGLKDLDGRPVSADDLRGRVVLVEFWATWCPPCKGTLEFLEGLRRRFGDRVAVLAPAVESDESDVRRMTAALPSVRVLMATPEMARSFGDISAVPTLHLFGADGRRIDSFYGAPPTLHATVEAAIRHALPGSPGQESR